MNYATVTNDKSKKKALIICSIGRMFVAHQFYVGNIGKGILYLCTAGLDCFGWIADIIKISTGSFKDNFGTPLRK